MDDQLASVYGLKDTRNGEIFYVGMSTDPYSRYGEHLSLRGKSKASAKGLRILDLRKNGLLPELVIFEQEIPSEKALERENFWIHHHLSIGSPLTNTMIPKKKSLGVLTNLSDEYSSGPIDHPHGKQLYDIKEVAELFELSDRSIYRMVAEGKLKGFKIKNSWRFDKDYIHPLIGRYSYTAQQERFEKKKQMILEQLHRQ